MTYTRRTGAAQRTVLIPSPEALVTLPGAVSRAATRTEAAGNSIGTEVLSGSCPGGRPGNGPGIGGRGGGALWGSTYTRQIADPMVDRG